MNYYLLIRGPLGCGKSTIADRLSKILDAEYVAMDKVLEKYGLDIDDTNEGCIPAKNFIRADGYLLPELNSKLANGKIVIIDGCFYHKEHIEHVLNNLQYPRYIFTLKSPVETCIDRDSKRSKTCGKDAAMVVHNLVSKFDYGIVIDNSNKTVEQTVEEILSYLPKRG